MLEFKEKKYLTENEYDLTEEAKNASLYTTGNGYMGVRGSLEEFGSTKIQGAFIRGYIDEITEIVEPFCDNIYMKKYYIDEEKLKHFQKQVSCVNLPDFLLIRITVGESVFYPWEGKLIFWKRELNAKNATLSRRVVWEDGNGNRTEFLYERFASFSEKHNYYQKVRIRPLNHTLPIKIISGIDTAVRTNGQIVLKDIEKCEKSNCPIVGFKSGEKYGFKASIIAKSCFYANGKPIKSKYAETGDLAYNEAFMPQTAEYVVEKRVGLYTERDVDVSYEEFKKIVAEEFRYDDAKKIHTEEYKKFLDKFDVFIDGDERSEAALRFANYHTIISANTLDSVHGISAKGLTGEKYNQFVWWDSEIYQMPFFIHSFPEEAKNLLLYRYKMLEDSRKNARAENKRGARYAFVSSVDGREHVWAYARHPFLQIHINSDVAFGVIDYFRNTGDLEFMRLYGMEMLYEIGRYWIDRVTFKNSRYEILNVTGTDEHHPYVNNDAYTNYLTAFVLGKIIEYDREYDFGEVKEKIGLTDEELAEIDDVSNNMYLPLEENGMIPQFDGYFSLSRTLETKGNSAKNFQMKQGGLYHKSQVIKQPDVMLLFSYLGFDICGAKFSENWDYYEQMCESSSSLTFPVHAICSAIADRPLSYLKYFSETTEIDIKDIHSCAYQGVHSGCLAGAWMSVFFGICGAKTTEKGITLNPHPIPFWEKVDFNFEYLGKRIYVTLSDNRIVLRSLQSGKVKVFCKGKEYDFGKKLAIEFAEQT